MTAPRGYFMKCCPQIHKLSARQKCVHPPRAIKAVKRDDLRRTAESLALPPAYSPSSTAAADKLFSRLYFAFSCFIWTLIASA
jgi:hypothetical protein